MRAFTREEGGMSEHMQQKMTARNERIFDENGDLIRR
jgi:hypothetical protein